MKIKDFREYINILIKEIQKEYREKYKTIKMDSEGKEIKEFLLDIWGVRINNEKEKKYLENACIQVSFHDKENPLNVVNRNWKVKKVSPVLEQTPPLWYLLRELGKCEAFHLFISPNMYVKNKKNLRNISENIRYSNCYFVDIDMKESNIPIYNYSDDEIRTYIKKKYDIITKVFYPSYIVMSGYGLHLYFTLEEGENLYNKNFEGSNRSIHKKITEGLIREFSADYACKNLNRILRMPYSTNWKYPIKTRLIINSKYIKKYKREEMFRYLFQQTRNTRVSTEEQQVKMKNGNRPDGVSRSSEKKKCPNRKNGKIKMYRDRKSDLIKWHSWHKEDMKGRRHNFFFIYIYILRGLGAGTKQIEKECEKLNNELKESIPYREILSIIQSGNSYKFKNETIADLLGFMPDEIDKMKSHYTEKSKKLYREEMVKKRSDEGKRIRAIKKEKIEQERFLIIGANLDASYSELAKKLDMSKSSARRWKKKYLFA